MVESGGDHTAKSRLLRIHSSESQFADDLALYAVNHADSDIHSVEVDGGMIEMVEDFTYLGSNLSSNTCEVNCWIVKASKTFNSL